MSPLLDQVETLTGNINQFLYVKRRFTSSKTSLTLNAVIVIPLTTSSMGWLSVNRKLELPSSILNP